MKKSIKIIFSLIIAFAILAVPFTTMAASDYSQSKTIITEGSNSYELISGYTYTVFKLAPTATGDYTITVDDALIGIVSYLDMWVQFEPTDEIVNLTTIEWKCTDVNQSILIAVKSESDTVTLNVSRKDLDTSNEVEWTYYENKTVPQSFVIPEFLDVSAFDDGYVDFEDSKIDTAVLGDDGYYHLNQKDGPVLFANLNDPLMSIYSMSGYGRVAATYYDESGKLIKKVDYTDAFNQYIAALPTNAQGFVEYYYPLTDDLIEMFKEIGASHGWYSGDEPWIYDSEDAWMFACYYDENVTSMNASENEDNNNSGNNAGSITGGTTNNNNTSSNGTTNNNNNTNASINNNTSTGNNTTVDNTTTSPSTNDSIVGIMSVLLLGVSLIVTTKKFA